MNSYDPAVIMGYIYVASCVFTSSALMIRLWMYVSDNHSCVYACCNYYTVTHTCTHTHMHACMHTHTHTHTYAHTHTHTYTHTNIKVAT